MLPSGMEVEGWENPAELIPQMVKIQSTVVQFVQKTDLYFYSPPILADLMIGVMENFWFW